jgi:hypothetical protein
VALLVVACLIYLTGRNSSANLSTKADPGTSGREVAVPELLIRPFISEAERGEIFIDGGAVMVADERFPRLRLGGSSAANPLQLAMLIDCTQSSSTAATLPPLELYLLPVHQTDEAKALHQTLLAVNLSSSQPQCLITLVAELAEGNLEPTAAAVTRRIATLEPELHARWEGLIEIRNADLEKAFESARMQLRRNAPHLSDAALPQVTALDSVMLGTPEPTEFARFLSSAANRQNKYLASAEGATRVSTARPCNCGNAGHDHSLSRSAEPNSNSNPNPNPTAEKALDARPAAPQGPSSLRRSAQSALPLRPSQARS